MPTLSDSEKKVLASLARRETYYASLMQKQLASSLNQIYAEMTKIYDKWAVNGVLTKVEMTRYNKYQTMEKVIMAKLDPAIKENIKTIKKLLPDMYDASFFQYAWAVDMGVGVNLAYGAVNTKAILAAFDITNPKNIELKADILYMRQLRKQSMEALKNYGPTAKKRIRAAMLKGLTMGKSYRDMARDLKKTMETIYSSAMTIARTEGGRAISRAQNDVYTQALANGVDGNIIWDATLDQKTRPTHGVADGQIKKDGYFVIGEYKAEYPLDPNLPAEESINCRCRERLEIDGYGPQIRRSREEGIIPYMNYDEYVKTYHPDWKAVLKEI